MLFRMCKVVNIIAIVYNNKKVVLCTRTESPVHGPFNSSVFEIAHIMSEGMGNPAVFEHSEFGRYPTVATRGRSGKYPVEPK